MASEEIDSFRTMSVYNTMDNTPFESDVDIPVGTDDARPIKGIATGQTTGGKIVKAVHLVDYMSSVKPTRKWPSIWNTKNHSPPEVSMKFIYPTRQRRAVHQNGSPMSFIQ